MGRARQIGSVYSALGNRAEVEPLLDAGEKWLDRMKSRFPSGRAHPGIAAWKQTVFELREQVREREAELGDAASERARPRDFAQPRAF